MCDRIPHICTQLNINQTRSNDFPAATATAPSDASHHCWFVHFHSFFSVFVANILYESERLVLNGTTVTSKNHIIISNEKVFFHNIRLQKVG